jgi:hypothetical protein
LQHDCLHVLARGECQCQSSATGRPQGEIVNLINIVKGYVFM